MKLLAKIILTGMLMFPILHANAWIDPERAGVKGKNNVQYRSDCAPATMSYDLAINNVRARLLNGGDMWWDLSDGQYIVPAVDPALGVPGVSSLFAGAVWLGGYDDADNLKVAAQSYRDATSNDFWPGPLSGAGTTNADTCRNWDRFFVVKGRTIGDHIAMVAEAEELGVPLNCELIAEELKKYPAKGNPYWADYYDFDLPSDNQGLGSFFDRNEDGLYNPCDGDYPAVEVWKCPTENNFPDEIVFWIYNDNGTLVTPRARSRLRGTPLRDCPPALPSRASSFMSLRGAPHTRELK